MASKLEASASTIVLFGPRASWAIATWQAGMFGRYLSIHSGYISRSGALVPAVELKRAFGNRRAKRVDQLLGLDLDHVGAEHHAEPFRRQTIGRDAGLLDGHVRRRERQLDRARHDLQAFARGDVSLGIEIAHVGSHANRELGAVEKLEPPHAALPACQCRAHGLVAQADGAGSADAGNDDFSRQRVYILETECVRTDAEIRRLCGAAER